MQAVLRTLAVTALMTVAASVGAPAPTHAATSGAACPTGRVVVVDFGALGGGVTQRCYQGTASDASMIVPAVGHTIVRDHQGAVCQIDARPGYCPPQLTSRGYWHLYWADGRSGWISATSGDGGLTIPCGGGVAWSWDTEAAGYDATPRVAAPRSGPDAACGPTASRSVKPATSPTPRTSPSTTAAGAQTSAASALASTTIAPTPTATASHSPRPHPTSAPSLEPVPVSAPTSGGSGGLPVWIAPVIIVVIGLASGAIVLVRRR